MKIKTMKFIYSIKVLLIAMLFSACIILPTDNCLAEDSLRTDILTAEEIIRKTDYALRADSNRTTATMTVYTPKWKRVVTLQTWAEGETHAFIRILSPAKERGISFLKLNSNMWQYLPNVERTIKLPPSMMMQSWMGSDFTNDDLVKESSVVYDYTHEYVGTEMREGVECYMIRLRARPDAPVVWGYIDAWIRSDNYLPMREEFYDEHNNLIKTLDVSKIKLFDGRPYPTSLVMKSVVKPGHETHLIYEDAVFNQEISENIFTLKNLSNGVHSDQ